MLRTQLCIVARSMSRCSDRAMFGFVIAIVVAVLSGACNDLAGRKDNRQANTAFREMRFIDAAAQYEKALTEVDDPIIHFNLGLTYSKVYRAGNDKPVAL